LSVPWLALATRQHRRGASLRQHRPMSMASRSWLALLPAVPCCPRLQDAGAEVRHCHWLTTSGTIAPCHTGWLRFTAAVGRGTDKARGSPFSDKSARQRSPRLLLRHCNRR
jgi:hypothetical protein